VAGGLSQSIFDSSYASIAGGSENRIENNSSYSSIGGGYANSVDIGALYGVIAGGSLNKLLATSSGIASGSSNRIYLPHSFIGGGVSNVIGGDFDSLGFDEGGCVIGGGELNTVHHGYQAGHGSVIAGGVRNSAVGDYCTIGGGEQNNTIGRWSTIPGGLENEASAESSFAAGHRASANHRGTFVWADSSAPRFSSTVDDGFFVRCVGGAKFVTGIDGNGDQTAGVRLGANESSWESLSDRNAKINFAAVNTRELLERLVEVPVQTWAWKTQANPVRHIGPMAQDFYAAFGVGSDDTHINTVDADGVALAAIQGLNEKLEEEVRALRAEVRDKNGRLAAVEAEVAELKRLLVKHPAQVE
jgi:hypothetical protein